MPCRLRIVSCSAIAAVAFSTWAFAQPVVIDGFDNPEHWQVITSDGVVARLRPTDGSDGPALRLEFDFTRGSGYCVIRRETSLELPENYRFSFRARGKGARNNLEFKLIDASNQDVWWVNRRAFEFPAQWRRLSQKRRHFRFAWGPSGGKPITRLGAIEFAVSASDGGRGYVELDQLEFEKLPAPQPVTHSPLVRFSSVAGAEQLRSVELGDEGRLSWRSAADDAHPQALIDFRQFREFGGLMIDWNGRDFGVDYAVSVSSNGVDWETAATIEGGSGGRDYIPLPESEAAQVRIEVHSTSRDRGVAVRGLRIMDLTFAESPNSMYGEIARAARPGLFPQYFLGRQEPWTVVGVVGDDREALIGASGAIEIDKAGPRLEPFLRVNGRLITWADVTRRQSLADDYLPIPTVTWSTDGLSLDITALAVGDAGQSELVAGYRIRNTSDEPAEGTLFVAVRPFQVLPPWQDLNVAGGVSKVASLRWNGRVLDVSGTKTVRPWTSPSGFGATTFASGDITEFLTRGEMPAADAVTDPARLASGAFRYDFKLAPGARETVILSSPFHPRERVAPRDFASSVQAERRFARMLDEVRGGWERELNRVELALPSSAARIVNTFRTTQAYILINADGPAIQPGSRTYERSWIRDGALTSTALLYTGHAERVRDFIDWYAPHQYEDGKVPCIVDRRGPDAFPEHDSTGQLIYLLLKYYRFTHDRACLEENLPRVVAGVDYIESLRSQRLTADYRDGPPALRACYGLVPESASHEGYCDKPMHSYWDSFFVVRGLRDAATIAGIVDRPDLQRRFDQLCSEYREALYDSMRLAMRTKGIDFIPGCVELGDFDATSTAIGVFPCGEYGRIPEPALTNTFERYYDFFRKRRDGAIEWDAYTPYEIRLVDTFIRLGQPRRAHELLDFFFEGQRPAGWNHWAEVVWRDPTTPKYIGDMPHTWVGSAYINAVRNMFVYEDEDNDSLVLAAGVKPEWLATASGIAVNNLPTEYGVVSYRLEARGNTLTLSLTGGAAPPPGGILLEMPTDRKAVSARASDDTAVSISTKGVLFSGMPPQLTVQTSPR